MKAKQKNLVLFLSIAMVLCVCASCGKYYGSVKDVASGMEDKDDTATLHNEMISIDVLHSGVRTIIKSEEIVPMLHIND